MDIDTIVKEHPIRNKNPKRVVSLANKSQGYSEWVVDVHFVKHIPIPNTSGKMVTENIDNSDVRGDARFIVQTRMVTGTIYLLAITRTDISVWLDKIDPTNLSLNS